MMRFMQMLFLAVMLVATLGVAKEHKWDEILCTCAVFGQKGNDKIYGEPLLTKAINIQAECDENGENICGLLCKALGQAAATMESQELCQAIQETSQPLRPTIYSKVCDAKEWTFIGQSSSSDYCCFAGKHGPCQGTTGQLLHQEQRLQPTVRKSAIQRCPVVKATIIYLLATLKTFSMRSLLILFTCTTLMSFFTVFVPDLVASLIAIVLSVLPVALLVLCSLLEAVVLVTIFLALVPITFVARALRAGERFLNLWRWFVVFASS